MMTDSKFQLHTPGGERKYITPEERDLFGVVAKSLDRETRTFCMLLRDTGVRISEGLSVSPSSIDLSAKCLTVETLKKRTGGIYRQIPLSDEFIDDLNLVHDLRGRQKNKKARLQPLWNWSRSTASRRVDRVMQGAGIKGVSACAKGLRHGFAVYCITKGIPLPTVQKWMGHASMETTAIYLQVTGKEERDLASRLW